MLIKLYKASSLLGTNTRVGKRGCGFQQENCLHLGDHVVCTLQSRWGGHSSETCFRDAGMPLFDHHTHFHIPIWLALGGYNRTICENGTLECVVGYT